MGEVTAVRVALDLMHVPSRVRLVRSDPLPEGVPLLLRLAAGEDKAEAFATELTGRSRTVVREAAAFFIEQILLSPDADSYRVLGASPEATPGELRRNMALLVRWLHPDKNQKGDRSMFATRVTLAWNDVKTPERRAAYDEARTRSHAQNSGRSKNNATRKGTSSKKRPPGVRTIKGAAYCGQLASPRTLDLYREERRGLLARALLYLLRGAKP